MLLATYKDFFNTDKDLKKKIDNKKDTKELKNSILESVKKIIEENKQKKEGNK